MFGLIPKRVELPFDADAETVANALRALHSGFQVSFDNQRFKIVYGPIPQEPVTVIEGELIDHGNKCVIGGKIRWSRFSQLLLLISMTFLFAFCFGIPALMIRSYFMGTVNSSVGHPLVIPMFWMVVTWVPFHFLLRAIYKSRLPKIKGYLEKTIGEQDAESDRQGKM